MKTKIFSVLIVLMTTVAVQAQQIAVVSSNGTTTIHRTLEAAITAATANSVIYLPGGGFSISDEVKITNKITIIGIGHKVRGENADGYTTITGNLYFNEGSSGSAVMGCYITGNIYIGDDNKTVNDILVRYCNLNQVRVQNSTCTGTVVNQNYIRGISYFSGSEATCTNNVAYSFSHMTNGVISYNVITGAVSSINSSSITDNVIYNPGNSIGEDCLIAGNMCLGSWGDDPISISGSSWSVVFVKYKGISPFSDFHFIEDYQQYEGSCGIYAGSGFSDGQLPPAPFIVEKSIPEQTDASGNLNIRIRVKAGE